jgi:uncharacterized hydrophobic protein (TIGR00341 family)
MALRKVEVYLPAGEAARAEELLGQHTDLGVWREDLPDGQSKVVALLRSEETGGMMDSLEEGLAGLAGFRVLLVSVEASLPRPEIKEEPAEAEAEAEKKPSTVTGISREELYEDIGGSTRVTGVYVALIILSSIVAAIGLLRGSTAVIIGAMVIAPLIGPNMALSLGTTLGDVALIREGSKALALGLATAFIFAALLGMALSVDPHSPEVSSRAEVELVDIVLPLASGSVAAISYTTAIPSGIIGVMVAAALLPPLVDCGLLFGSGHADMALRAALLLLANLICINLAGVVTFNIQGVRPLRWWEAEKARRATARAIILWGLLLAMLVAVIYLSKG